MRIGAHAANVGELCVRLSSRSSSCSQWPRPPLPIRSPMSTVAMVWLSSLDGAQKVRLATPVVNSSGETEKWLAVAASDSGRIVAARNVPGRISRFSSFKVWEPNGTSTVEGPLNAPTAPGHVRLPARIRRHRGRNAHGLWPSNSSSCCPITTRGDLIRPRDQQLARPDQRLRPEHPTLIGDRMIVHTGDTVIVQNVSAAPYRDELHPLDRFGDRTSTSAAPTSRRTASSSQPS